MRKKQRRLRESQALSDFYAKVETKMLVKQQVAIYRKRKQTGHDHIFEIKNVWNMYLSPKWNINNNKAWKNQIKKNIKKKLIRLENLSRSESERPQTDKIQSKANPKMTKKKNINI